MHGKSKHTFYFQLSFFPKIVPFVIVLFNVVESNRPRTIGRMRFACCIPTTTNTHSEYVILTAFPFQQWLHECASILTFIRTAPNLCKYATVQSFRDVRNTAVGIATRYGLDGPGFETQWGGRDICTRPHRPRGPPSLMYTGYRVSFSGGKAARKWH
jgi:hypothetical protein